MVRRNEQASFGAAYAFPGGVVDPEDSEVHDFCVGLSHTEASSHLGVEDSGLDYYSSAIRELFEESGVLLADVASLDEDMKSARDALNDGILNWAELVKRNELPLRCEQLHYVSHWVTPTTFDKRYSTRFFLAELPAGQVAKHCSGELTDSLWSTASDMLLAGRRGEVKVPYATVKTLESVARYKTLASLVDWARSCAEWGITSVMPVQIKRDGRQVYVLPGDRDYPGAES